MDATKTKGWWLLPSRGHVHDRLPTFLKWAVKAKTSTPGIILVEEGDFDENRLAYVNLLLPEGWRWEIVEGASTGERTENAYRRFCQDADWVGWLADDNRAITEHWDTLAIGRLTGWNFVSTDDGVFAPRKASGATVWSGDLLRAVGWLYPPGLKHFFFDDCWEQIGRTCNVWTVDMSILMQHDHDLVTGRLDQMTSAKNAFWANDTPAFQKLKSDGELHRASERVMAMLAGKGFGIVSNDMTGIRLMLATPSVDGRYESIYCRTKDVVADYIRQLGGEFVWAEMPYSTQDYARTKLLNHFYRSGFTHLLWLDGDQGANPNDILRMIKLKKDFVAVAGVRKTNPPSYAVTSQDDLGNPVPIQVDSVTGLMTSKVIRVGMACVVMTRHCVERMIQSYPELAFRGADGQDDIACFLPMILNNRYLNEDFAFCWRYNAIGGTIWIDGSISIDHIGPYVYQGSYYDHLENMQAKREAAEAELNAAA